MAHDSARTTGRLVVCIALISLAGCNSFRGYPETPENTQGELKTLATKYYPTGSDILVPPTSPPIDATAWRNEVVNGRLRIIDIEFQTFEVGLSQEGVGLNSGSDIAVIALGATGALTGTAATKALLAGISAGVTGTKGVIDKDVFYSKTMPALLTQMEAGRKAELVIIRNSLKKSIDDYPLGQALIDVDDYYKAGSIPGAIQGIISTSGSQAEQSTAELKQLAIPTQAQLDLATQMEAAREKDFNDWNQNKDTPKGNTALGRLQSALKVVDPTNAAVKSTDGQVVYDAINAKLPDLYNNLPAGPQQDALLKKLVDALTQ